MSKSEIPQASYRYLGKAGLRVSIPIFGGMNIGDPNWNAFPLLKAAWDSGVTTFDLANMYSNGVSEKLVSEFIKENKIPRNKLVLMDKIRYLVDKGDTTTLTSIFKLDLKNTRDYVNQSGLSRSAILNQFQDCLERLGTDYLDVLFLHGYDPQVRSEEIMCTLNDLVRSGKVRYLGLTNFKVWQLVEMNNIAKQHGWTEFSCVQLEHSLVYRSEEHDMMEYCNYKGMGVLAFNALGQGYLARPHGTQTPRSKHYEATPFGMKLRQSDIEIINRIATIAKKYGYTRAQVALLWSLRNITSPIIGVNNPERLFEAVAIKGKSITDEDAKYLEEPRFAGQI
ncbi:hypothetical protein Clacol_006176 [Clathrus columnatus]|uniref:NADP-dependent oxidoreductase domain-containing protein n=1 Tax=Clathrus columnatus TaxID=1419009 RepID=A0AAV5AGX3_9AGAM|nr:hypothetical protein Clacol_006176 [Clathrus columnatus]